MTVNPTSEEYAKSPRWFWAQKMLGTEQDWWKLRGLIYGAAMAQPWPAKGLEMPRMEAERAWQIGNTHLREWATSQPFDVWGFGYGFRCVRFGSMEGRPPSPGGYSGVVAVCTASPDGKSTDQVFMIEASAGAQWPEKRPPTPGK